MPSPLLQLRIPQDLADWLEAKYPSRGEVAAYVRELLTAEQMKEAVAPLVPTSVHFDSSIQKVGPATVEDWKAFQDDALTPEEHEILTKAWFPNEFDAHKAKPVPQLSVEGEPLNEYEMATGYRQEPKPKARRKKKVESTNQTDSIIPIPCHCGGKIYQVGSRKGQCSGCGSPKPLKGSK